MVNHTFESCLEYEASKHKLADEILRAKYPDKNIRRCSYEHDKVLQQHDVDVVITNKTGWPNDWYISEKFRTSHFPDVLIELWSDFKRRKDGWSIQSVAHEYYFYHKDYQKQYLRIIPAWLIKRLAKEARDLYEQTFQELLDNRQSFRPAMFKGAECELRLISTENKKGIPLYYGANIIIPLDTISYINKQPIQEELILCNSQENKSSNAE